MLLLSVLLLSLAALARAQQYAGGAGAYEAELQRRQMEYLQQQRLRHVQNSSSNSHDLVCKSFMARTLRINE